MSGLRTLRIGTRLTLAFGLILLILAGSAGVGVWRLGTLADATHRLGSVDTQRMLLAQRWMQTIDLNWARTKASLQSADPSRMAQWQAEMDATSDVVDSARKRLHELITTDMGRRMLAEVDARREAYRGPRADLLKRRLAGEDVSAELDRTLAPLARAYIGSIEAIQKQQELLFSEALRVAEEDAAQGRAVLLASGALAVLLGALFAWLIARSITVPLGQAGAVARRIAGGDLTEAVQAQGKDEAAELLQALGHMQEQLAGVVAEVRRSADSVASASVQIAQGNNDLSSRTEEQASALQQTAASMEQLSATVQQNADAARQAGALVAQASEVATRGGAVVSRVVGTMKSIQDSSSQISSIIGVIDSIAFQTNILALNAAVEAARAGDQGRGFAVVATEVRNLAGRSAEAAREIKALIGTSVERVEQGTALVDEAGATMQDVVQAIGRVNDLAGGITAASAEQSAGVSQIGEAISQMDQTTQQNAALVEESAAAADSLRGQAQQLVQAMAAFRVAGRAAPLAAPQPAPQPARATAAPVRAPARSAPAAPGKRLAAAPARASAAREQRQLASSAADDWESF